MIAARLEKLRFIVEEMQLAFYLAQHLTDPFAARTLARHILIRAENFIEHARGLRRPLNQAGFNTTAFNTTKEAYASQFEEYFKESRHRLGAHVHDWDFGRRIELWNDIETGKVGYFVEGARQIYQDLAALRIPDYVAYAEPHDLIDPALADTLRQVQRAIDSRNWVEMGTDSLALTRSHTAAPLNGTPVQARAAQLALIRRWIAFQRDLYARLAAYPAIQRILKTRMITDIVSFCDCLVTRPVAVGAPQQMDGLDSLLKAERHTSAPIDNFVAASNFHAELQAARAVRDHVGAHLEIDTACDLPALLAEIAAYDLDQGLCFYDRVAAAFIKTCFSVLFMRIYAADGSRMYGVTAGHNRAVPYADDNGIDPAPPPAAPAIPPINDEEAYRTNLVRWIDGDETQKDEARQFFWNAFMHSDVAELIDDAGRRHQFRKAHQFLSSILPNLPDQDFTAVLQLILACRNGAPYPLSEVLVRYGGNAAPFRQWAVCFTLGEVSNDRHASAIAFLQAGARSPLWPIRLRAALARFKIFLKTEGIFRTNHPGRADQNYDQLVQALLEPMPENDRLVCLLGFASILSRPFAVFSKPFDGNYAALQTRIETLCLPLLGDRPHVTRLRPLIKTHDYVGVALLVATNLGGGDQHPLYTPLIDNCCKDNIAAAHNDQALRHLAMCFHLMNDNPTALDLAEDIAARNPDWVDAQVLAVQVLGEIPGEEEKAAAKVAEIRRSYNLDADQQARIANVEAEITARKQ